MSGKVYLPNKYVFEEDQTKIVITNKKGITREFIIDNEEYEKVKRYNWSLGWRSKIKDYYAQCSLRYEENGKRKGKTLLLHYLIMNAQKGECVDHKSHNVQDTRKSNLRKSTNAENSQHRKGANINNKTTGIRNVNWIEAEGVYRVQICKNYKRYKWDFPADKFDEACQFAIDKRKELFQDYAGIDIITT